MSSLAQQAQNVGGEGAKLYRLVQWRTQDSAKGGGATGVVGAKLPAAGD